MKACAGQGDCGRGTDVDMSGWVRKWGPSAVGGVSVSAVVFLTGLWIFGSSEVPLGFVGIVSLAHAALGVGFFSGFVVFLFLQCGSRK